MAVRQADYDYPTVTGRTRQQFGDDARNNILAMIDGFVMGSGPANVDAANGWQMSAVTGTGTAEAPQFHVWTNSASSGGTTQRVRATYTRSGNYITSILWEWTENNGSTPNGTGTWTTIKTTTVTYTSNNMTGGNNSSITSWFFELLGKFFDLRTLYNAHVALTTGAHGTGTIALQSAAAVNIDGGTIDSTTIGTTTAATARFTRAVEQINNDSAGTGAQTLDWTRGASNFTTTSALTLNGANFPASGFLGTHVVRVAHFDATTFTTVDWGSGGKPTLGVNKAAEVLLITRNGGTNIYGSVMWRQA